MGWTVSVSSGKRNTCTYLLVDVAIGKDVLQGNVKLAHVVPSDAVLVPADAFQQGDAEDGQVKGHVPLGIEGLGDGGRGFPGITERDDKILHTLDTS